MRKYGLILLIVALLTMPCVYAKSSPKLSAKKLTITVGKTKGLTVKNTTKKAKWSRTKKIVTLKTKGKKKHKVVIKALKPGKCYVKVKVGKKTLKCKVIVKKKPSKLDDEFKEKPISTEDITSRIQKDEVEDKAIDDNFKLAFANVSIGMLQKLSNENRNILISPDSILTAFAMVENGADGNTLAEMESVFGVSNDDMNKYFHRLNTTLQSSQAVKYKLADSIWYRSGRLNVKDDFLKKNVDFLDAHIFEAAFNEVTLVDINNWVYNNTQGMIEKIIDKLSEDSVMVLLNAIYFEGDWSKQYADSSIKNEPFYNDDRSVQKTTKIMYGIERNYVNIKGAHGFLKTYKGGKMFFMGIETPEGKTVDEFLATLSGSDFVNGFKNRTSEYEVHTKMPEFKYSYDTSLVNTLKSLGIVEAFNPFGANFNRMATMKPNQNVYISDVLHKTQIEVNKEGTKAAAATGIIIEDAMDMPAEAKYVNLDHPFIYAIVDENGIPLFIGVLRTV